MNDNGAPLLRLECVTHGYGMGEQFIPVLRDVSFEIERGSAVAIVGPSGSGKSTLLNILGLLDRPASGRLYFNGRDLLDADLDELALVRNREIGFVFQAFNLIPRLTALDNVALPLTYRGVPRAEARVIALEQIENVGLAKFIHHRPAELSGGQCQRIAIARALAMEPSMLLADEPTGNLDTATANNIVELLLSLHRERGLTLVIVTHDLSLASRLHRRIEVQDGRCKTECFPVNGKHS